MDTSRKTIVVIAIAQLVNYLLPLITFPLLVKSLTISDYGMWIEAGTIVGLSVAFIFLGLNAAVNLLVANQPEQANNAYSNAFYLSGGIAIVLTVLLIVFAPYLNTVIIRQPSGSTILRIVAVLILVGAFNELTGLIFRLNRQATRAASFTILLAVGRLISAIYAALQHELI